MKLLYLANLRLPTEKAYGLQIAKMCQAFSENGADVELIAPTRQNGIKEDLFSYYSVKKVFNFRLLKSPDFYWPGKLDRIAVLIKGFISAFILAKSTLKTDSPVFSRDELPLYLLSFFKKKLYFEAHKYSKARSFFYNRFKKRGIKIIVLTVALKRIFIGIGFDPDKVLVAPDGVDLNEFDIAQNTAEIRAQLSLPSDKMMIGYVGQLRTLGMEKGVEDLIGAFKNIRSGYPNAILVIVGGDGEVLEKYKKYAGKRGIKPEEIIFTGQVRHRVIPRYLKAFDILAMPFPNNEHFAHYMSPLKMFEYMAAKKPIVVSDLPSVREILDEKSAAFFEAGDLNGLAGSIKKVMDDKQYADQLADRAFFEISKFTWEKRARKISDFLG